MRPLFIVGYMGTGKSTIGRHLSEALGYQFVDTDIFIENRFRRRVFDIFAEVGEEVFRKRERFVLEELVGLENTVIATGGGLPCFYNNMSLMKESGKILYLEAEARVLVDRLEKCKRTRPTIAHLSGEDLLNYVSEALERRVPIYQEADFTQSVNEVMTPEDEAVLAWQLAQRIRPALD